MSLFAILMSAAAGAALLAGPAHAVGPAYVALGDSYSSGTGTAEYIDEECHRSEHAYAPLAAADIGADLTFEACHGAVIQDVLDTQLAALRAATRLVTVSIGGNDAGFATVVTACNVPFKDCTPAIAEAEAYIADTLPGRLAEVYGAIRDAAPAATVVVVGYPRLFNGATCNWMSSVSPEEQVLLNGTADRLAEAIGTVAAAFGFAFADPREAFDGHRICDPEPWLNDLVLTPSVAESYHPNVAGHAGYRDLVLPLLPGVS